MSEERMIRVKKEDYEYIQEIDDANSALVGQEIFPSEEFQEIFPSEEFQEKLWIRWNNLEPAPPKNWEELVAKYETELAKLRFQIGGMQMDKNASNDWEPFCFVKRFDDTEVEGECDFSYWKHAEYDIPMDDCVDCPYRKKRE